MIIEIINWDKHNPRKDIKNPSWLAINNRMIEDTDIYDLTDGEFRAWIYCISRASQVNNATVKIDMKHAQRVSGVNPDALMSMIEKMGLKGAINVIEWDKSEPVQVSVRGPYADVRVSVLDKQTNKQTNKQSIPDFDIGALYQAYPKKEGKKKGIANFKRRIKSQEDFERAKKAISNYVDSNQNTERQFLKHFDTFSNCWEDYVEIETPQSQVETIFSELRAKYGEESA